MTLAKICGLTTPETLDAALDGGAAFVGAVMFPKSPRHLEPLHAATLFDRARGRAKVARPPQGSDLPGGVGASFDWSLLAGRAFQKPWFLAGGLTPDNVARALAVTRAPMVDVSSGVESAPGVKDTDRIKAFLKAV